MQIDDSNDLQERPNNYGNDNYEDKYNRNVDNSNSNPQLMEFSVLGIGLKWRGTLIFSIFAISILLNVFMLIKIININSQISTMQKEMYERVIQEIKPDVEKIQENIDKTNEILENKNNENENEY